MTQLGEMNALPSELLMNIAYWLSLDDIHSWSTTKHYFHSLFSTELFWSRYARRCYPREISEEIIQYRDYCRYRRRTVVHPLLPIIGPIGCHYASFNLVMDYAGRGYYLIQRSLEYPYLEPFPMSITELLWSFGFTALERYFIYRHEGSLILLLTVQGEPSIVHPLAFNVNAMALSFDKHDDDVLCCSHYPEGTSFRPRVQAPDIFLLYAIGNEIYSIFGSVGQFRLARYKRSRVNYSIDGVTSVPIKYLAVRRYYSTVTIYLVSAGGVLFSGELDQDNNVTLKMRGPSLYLCTVSKKAANITLHPQDENKLVVTFLDSIAEPVIVETDGYFFISGMLFFRQEDKIHSMRDYCLARWSGEKNLYLRE